MSDVKALFGLIDKKNKRRLIGAVICCVLSVLCGILPYLGVWGIVTCFLDERTENLFQYVCLIAVAIILKHLLFGTGTKISHKVAYQTLGETRKKLFRKIARLPMGYVKTTASGQVKTIIMDNMEQLETFYAHNIPEIISGLAVPLCIEEKKGICYSEEVLKERKKELHTHSIECLYKLACDKKNIDRRIPAYFENIEDMIYFYYFDEEGDAFKYELNKEDEPHMIKNKISHVSIELLETEFKEVMKKFDDLIYFLDNCIFEYSLGTFTKSLSRADIWDISKRLPVYEEWRTEKFKEVKDEIKQEYHLGSKEFSDAVNLIKENREFSVNIGCEKVFGSITENELKEYASLVRYYSEKSKSDNKGKEIGFDLRKIQKNGEILKKYLSSISMNTLNTLLCFSEMSNSFLAVEHLEEVHDDIVSKAFDGTYLIRKLKQRNICLRILYGMKKCGQVTYAKQLSAALEQEGVELTL